MGIEKVGKSDYFILIEIWEASVRASHDFLSEADISHFKGRILDEFFDLVDLYSHKNETRKTLGFLGISPDKIEMLFILPEQQGKGIGKLLLNFAITQKGITKVDVNEQNPRAVGFYKKRGFQIIHRNALDAEGKPFAILEMD
jgi:putative acetyltransferase